MPSEQRLHPATLLFDVAKHVKNFAVPALLMMLGVSQSTGGPGDVFGRTPDRWEAWLLVLLVPSALASAARYLSFRLRYDERELVIRSGLVFRNERHIPYARIQNVDAIQNVFHRVFGVVVVRVETGGGKEEEARLSVLPRAAFDDIRRHVFEERSRLAEEIAEERGDTLVHLPLSELLLCGVLENKGLVLIGAGYGIAWETGLLGTLSERVFAGIGPMAPGFGRDLIGDVMNGRPLTLGRIGMAVAGLAIFLVIVRLASMLWALFRLYDFRLTRVQEDLRSEYGLLTRVSATIPIRRVQTIVIRAGPWHRWLHRATVRVETAGGATTSDATVREWLAPLIRNDALPTLLRHVLPGFDLEAVTWQPVHPRAFARAVKPMLLSSAAVALLSALAIGWGAIGVLVLTLLWSIIAARQYVSHLGWAEGPEVVMIRSGWIWRRVTLARLNKIQVVAMHASPFDRRAAMARVRVDTAGAKDLSDRVDVPYLDQGVARALTERLSAAAASTTFRW